MKDDFLENSYISKLKNNGYIEVEKMDIIDGIYAKEGGGYEFKLLADDTHIDTGYVVVSNEGIRGMWNPNRDKVMVVNGLPSYDITGDREINKHNPTYGYYKLMSKAISDIRNEKIEQVFS